VKCFASSAFALGISPASLSRMPSRPLKTKASISLSRASIRTGLVLPGEKMYPKAIEAPERVVHSGRDPQPLASLACAYGLAGRKREALKLIDELKQKIAAALCPRQSFCRGIRQPISVL
jgi:hypothetical protein